MAGATVTERQVVSASEVEALQVRELSPTYGTELLGVDVARIREDDEVPHLVLQALDAHGLFDEQIASWRERPPVVRANVVGTGLSMHDHIVGMDVAEGRATPDDMLARATAEKYVYTHSWTAGDTVIWDNRGLYRGRPFDPTSERRMHRSSLLGKEAIR